MSKTYWYAGLALLGLIVGVFVICKRRHVYKVSTLIAFYLFATGITWIGEYLALGIFNGYEYRTDIINNNWAQNLIGHLFLNITIWPAAALLFTAYQLRYRWIPVITAFFIFAEYLFLKLKIYEQHWWRYYMSVIIVVAFLLISRSWFTEMDRKRAGLVRVTTYFFICLVIIHIPFPFLLLLDKQYYKVEFLLKIVGDRYLASIIFTFAYHLVIAFFLTFAACILKKWYWKPVPYVIACILQIILAKTKILILQDNWNLLYTLLIMACTHTTFILLEKYTWRPDGQRK